MFGWFAVASAAPSLDYVAPVECSDGARFADEVSARIGSQAFDGTDAATVKVRIASTSAVEWIGTLEAGDGSRAVSGVSCGAVFDGLVVTAATLLGPIPAAPTAPAAPEVVGEVPSLEAARAFRDRRLYRGTLTGTSVSMVPVGSAYLPISTTSTVWVVNQGTQPLSTLRFAEVVGDRESYAAIKERREAAGTWALAGTLGAVGSFAGAFALAFDAEPGNDGAAFALLGTALGSTIAGAVGATTSLVKANSFHRAFGEERTDTAINTYNDGLQAELGLTDGQVLAIEGMAP